MCLCRFVHGSHERRCPHKPEVLDLLEQGLQVVSHLIRCWEQNLCPLQEQSELS